MVKLDYIYVGWIATFVPAKIKFIKTESKKPILLIELVSEVNVTMLYFSLIVHLYEM